MILTDITAKKILKEHLKIAKEKFNAVKSDDKETAEKQKKVKTWVLRKFFLHPHLVYKCAQDLKKEPEILSKIKDYKINKEDFFRTIDVNALLHDIGRIKEVDFNIGLFIDSKTKNELNITHAIESYNILKELGITDKNILLPIKYHDSLDFYNKIINDSEFKNLSSAEQKNVLFYGKILVDIDKMSNILEVSHKGLKGRLELIDPKYKSEAKISPKIKKAVLNGQDPYKEDENTRADALVRFACWTSTLNFEASKNIAKIYMEGIFNYIKNEMPSNQINQVFIDDVEEIYNYLKKRK